MNTFIIIKRERKISFAKGPYRTVQHRSRDLPIPITNSSV